MKPGNLISFIIFILSAHVVLASPCTHTTTSFNCVKYERPVDGDTFEVSIPGLHPLIGKKVKIRVSGVDSPEINRAKNACEKEKGRTAKKLVDNLLKRAKRIDLKNIQRGKYFRIAADVLIDGTSLKSYLIKNQLGVPYGDGKKPKVNWCKPLRHISSKSD